MALRKAHGRGASGLVRVETLPADEQPVGVAEPTAPIERRSDGSVTAAGARELGRRGGLASARRRKLETELASCLGLADLDPSSDFAPYVQQAVDFAETQLARMAEVVGGGEVGPGPASMVQSAALALAASRMAYARGDVDAFAKAAILADRSKQALMAAHEMCAREAAARRTPADQTALVVAQLRGGDS